MKKHLVTVGKISEYLIYGFLVFVLFIILSPRLPTKNLIQSYIVPTGSMYPTVRAGSVVFVNPKAINTKVGDIIAFTNPNDSYVTVLHRVHAIDDKGITTKGDNNNAPDNWLVKTDEVKGTLVFAVPYLGHIAAFVKTPVGFVILAIVPASLLAISFLLDIKNGIFEEVAKRKQKNVVTKIIIIAFLFASLGFSMGKTKVGTVFAAFTAQATLRNISISVAAVTPPPSPTPFPTPTPTVAPHPSIDCDDLDLKIEGDDDHFIDRDSIFLKCFKDKVFVHFKKLHNKKEIDIDFEYDSDEGRQGVRSDIHLDGESEISRDLYMGSCSSAACTPNTFIKNKKLRIKFL